jgi:PAS domain S-box-containing protein
LKVSGKDGEEGGATRLRKLRTGIHRAASSGWDTEEMFRLLVSSVRDYAIFMLDPDGRVVTWNAGAERIKGYTADDIIGRHFSVFYTEEEAQSGKPQWELVVAAAEGRTELEGFRVRKDGSSFYANVIITALRDETGRLRGYAKVTRDITQRKEEERIRQERQRAESEQLRQHANRMAALERTKTEFLNLASHELRGPLVVARGYFSLLEDGSLTPEQFLEVAPLVSAKLSQMEVLVRQLLETARLESDQLELTREVIDLRQIVKEQAKAIRPLLTEQHRLEVSCPKEEVWVFGDKLRLGAVIVNLMDNAVKYSPAGGLVEVLVTIGGDQAFVSVRDHGLGVSDADMDRLFTRFGRIDNPEARHIGGTGLGLYLSREIAHRHDGDILVDSEPGVGSRFTLSLPLEVKTDEGAVSPA